MQMTKITSKKKNLNSTVLGVALLAITGLSLLTRLWGFPQHMILHDTGMELLRAFHIARFAELPLVGVPAVSINFFHPPWHIFGLSIAANIAPDISTLLLLSPLFHGLAVIPLFMVAYIFLGPTIALISAILYSINPHIVQFSYSLQSQNIIVPIFLFALALWALAHRTKRTILLYGAVFALLFATTINYAAFLLLPFLCGYDLYQMIRNKRPTTPYIVAIGISTLVLYSPLLLYILMQYRSGQAIWLSSVSATPTQLAAAYHFYLVAPLFLIPIAWMVEHVWRQGKHPVLRFIYIGCVSALLLTWVKPLIEKPQGDFSQLQTCTNQVASIIRANHHEENFSVVVQDANHKNKWEYLTIFIEEALGKKLSHMTDHRNYYHWNHEGTYTYLICLHDPTQCTRSFQQDNPDTIQMQPLPTSCPVFLFERNNL
jgi:hypothetical protein